MTFSSSLTSSLKKGSFLALCFGLTGCKEGYINLAEVPDRTEPSTSLTVINEDLKALANENRTQNEFGFRALGARFTSNQAASRP